MRSKTPYDDHRTADNPRQLYEECSLRDLVRFPDKLQPNLTEDGFGGLVVSMMASGARVREFDPGRSRWIFPVW